jgi:hypothetical protein
MWAPPRTPSMAQALSACLFAMWQPGATRQRVTCNCIQQGITMKRKVWAVTAACLALGGVAVANSQFGKDLRLCYAVQNAAEKFPGFQSTPDGVLVSQVRDGVVTLHAFAADPGVASAIADGHTLDQLSSASTSARAFREFDSVIRWREGARAVEWTASRPGEGSSTNECGR